MERKKKLGKKGIFTQVIFLMVVIFIIAITVIIGKFILNEFYTAIDDIDTPASNEAQASVEKSMLSFDWAIILFTVILICGLIVTSFLIPSHPIFFVVNIFGIFVLVFMGMVMVNVYGELVAGDTGIESNISGTADQYPLTNNLIQYLPWVGAVVIFIASIVMFSRGYGGGSY